VVDKMKKMNPGFDDAEIHAKLQGVKTASSLLVAQAKVAASKGDLQAVQTQITRAAALWPNNPELQNFSAEMSRVSDKASPMVQALSDFDQLEGQANYRRIFDEKERYIAAVAADDSAKKTIRQEKLTLGARPDAGNRGLRHESAGNLPPWRPVRSVGRN